MVFHVPVIQPFGNDKKEYIKRLKKGREGGGGKDSQTKVEKGGWTLLQGYYYHSIQLIIEALPVIPMIPWVSKDS